MGDFTLLRRLLRNERGNVMAIGAAMMPLMIGSGALALDTIQLSLWKRQLQRAADSAALAGAHAVAQQKPAAAAVNRDLQLNNQVPLSQAVVVNNAPATGAYRNNASAVEVILTSRRALPFMSFFISEPPTINVRAVAAKVGGSGHCLLALDKDEKYAVQLTGNSNLNLGCGIASNSNHPEAMQLTGNAKVQASGISAVGGIEVSGSATFPESKRHAYSDPQVDPFGPQGRNLQVPTSPSECTSSNVDLNDRTVTLQPGRYCGFLKINGKSNVTFAPGVYIVDGEYFKIDGDSTVKGEGVTFILTGSAATGKWAEMHWNGNANINFSAPKVSSGSPYAGVLLMADPNQPEATKHFLNGNLALSMTGAMYLPSGQFFWNGNTNGSTRCLQLVARLITINGNPNIPNQCDKDDGVNSFITVKVRLVE